MGRPRRVDGEPAVLVWEHIVMVGYVVSGAGFFVVWKVLATKSRNVCICTLEGKYDGFVHTCDGPGEQRDRTKTVYNGQRFFGRLERERGGEKEAAHLLQTDKEH
jgi:hypothetical protein